MIEISKKANPNYLAKIVKLDGLRKHENADRLQCVDIDFQTVITGLDAKDGDIYVYFPVECKINLDFLSFTNSFRDKELNADREKAGFFEPKGRVKAMKLRGEKSMGYIVPLSTIENFIGLGKGSLEDYAGKEFDTVDNILLVEKYVVKEKKSNTGEKKGKKPKLSRIIDGQINLHVDTEKLEKNIHKLNIDDEISITYKTHGTSWWVSNVPVLRKLNWRQKLLKKIGVPVKEIEYDIVYGSRKVVKNKHFEDPKRACHYYGYDLWHDIKEQVKNKIPKGFTLYGECIGYTRDGAFIQGPYDYGCKQGEFKLEIYRITQTNADGIVTELSTEQIREFCSKSNLTPSYRFFQGTISDYIKSTSEYIIEDDVKDWRKTFIDHLRHTYNEKDCFMCINKVPEEGIIVRKEGLFHFEAYKLKSFNFLEQESKNLDKGETNLEDNN